MNPLKVKRQSLGLTQQQIADRLNMDIRNLTKYENDKRIFKTNQLLEIQKIYCLSNEELLEYIVYATKIMNKEKE